MQKVLSDIFVEIAFTCIDIWLTNFVSLAVYMTLIFLLLELVKTDTFISTCSIEPTNNAPIVHLLCILKIIP